MKKLLALLIFVAAAVVGPTAGFAFNGMQGGTHGGIAQGSDRGFHGNPGFRGNPGFHGFHANPGFHPFHGFVGIPARHPFFVQRGVVFVGVPFPVAVNAVGFVGEQPLYLYCQNPMGFFPEIQFCPTGWLQVSQ